MKLCDDTLNVKHDLGYVLCNTGDGGKLVKNAVDLNICYRVSGEGAQKYSAKRVSEGLTKASLEGLDHERSIGTVLAHFSGSYIGLLYLYHSK